MLPLPALTFTIPSVHDDTVLDCRVYFPPHFLTSANTQTLWRKKAAIVAHPYAPLGGCYDDPVVEVVVSQLLKGEFVVGTFNFRGAGTSKGHTSWTSKAEIKDYISMVGFMLYLMHGLVRPHKPNHEDPFYCFSDDDSNRLSPVPSHALPPPHSPRHPSSTFDDQSVAPDDLSILNKKLRPKRVEVSSLILIAGYSYGALVTTQLPDLPSIMELFSTPLAGSAASEIRLRAQQLAKQQNEFFLRLAAVPTSKSDSSGKALHPRQERGSGVHATEHLSPRIASTASSVRVGGEETDSAIRRASQEQSRHSFGFDTPERVRRSVDRVRSLSGRPPSREPRHKLPRRQTSSPEKHGPESFRSSSSMEVTKSEVGEPVVATEKMPLIDLGDVKVTYLLISPLHGIVPHLVTLGSLIPQVGNKWKNSKASDPSSEEEKLVANDTIAIFGDRDIFSSAKKLRSWAAKLSGAEGGRFIYAEISGAGHFWQEEGVVAKMKGAIEEFTKRL